MLACKLAPPATATLTSHSDRLNSGFVDSGPVDDWTRATVLVMDLMDLMDLRGARVGCIPIKMMCD
ncbi:hypothetical protein CH300_12840 [Rhodococcus sp. 15-1154-1]|nr:hypothetical protein CH300_12840 [Rhodococcus sp. 15-1154-1]